jgi:ribosomal protein L11 methyltransferase
VLDVGTGTGVLAIAAARSGASRVIGTDIDPVSVRIARENARLNRARARFLRASDLTSPAVRSGAPFDLVFANILPGPLVRLAPGIRQVVGPKGLIVLSGLLRRHERFVTAAYLARGFRLLRRSRREAWSTLTLERR